MDALPHRLSPPLKFLTFSTRALLWLILLAWLLFSAAWAALHLFIVPRIGELRPELETRASQALGVPVRIGAIVAHADSLLPSFELSDVRLLDREGRVALQLPRVHATLSPRSLWHLGFEQLAIERPELAVRRAADGRIFVAGIEIPQNQEGDGRGADWVFAQTEWIIRGGQVQWHDELLGAPPLQLQQVDLRMVNGVRLHEVRLDATPPAELGSRFSLRGRLRPPLLSIDAGRWQRWQGQFYAVFERVDVAQLRRHVPLPLDVSGGTGALRAWVDIDRGRVSGAAADVALVQVGLRLGPTLPALDLSRLTGRLGGRMLDGGFELSTEGLQFDTVDGLHWPGGDVRVTLQAGDGDGMPAQGEVRATGIDLAMLAQLARRLPLQSGVHETLALYAPRGRVEQLQARWRGPLETAAQFEARGTLREIEIAAGALPGAQAVDGQYQTPLGTPGVRGLSVDFDLTQTGGRASVVVQQGHLELPGVFEQPRIALDQLAAEVQWQRQGAALAVQVPSVRFANADAQGEAQFKWSRADAARDHQGSPGVLDLQGSLSRADLAAVHRYLPLALNPQVRDYLHQALPQGRGAGVRFRVKGDLQDFPFKQAGRGEFRVTASVQDARYVYVPASLQPAGQAPWPALTELSADLLIDHASLQLRNVQARVDGAPQLRIIQAEARIPEMGQDTRVLVSLPTINGPLDELLRTLVSKSPVDAMLGGLLGQVRAAGNTTAQLNLQLPLKHLDQATVRGQVQLAGNELQFAPQLPRLTRLRGVVHFSETGFALGGVQARLLGGDVRAEGGTIALPGAADAGPLRLRVQGTLTAQGLRQETQLGAVARLAQRFSGSTSYAAEFGLRQGVPEFNLSSDLQGLALDLPAPLSKPAEGVLPLRLQAHPLEVAAGTAQRPTQDVLRLDLGRLLAVRYIRDLSQRPAQVLRGSIGFGLPAGESLSLPDEGVVTSVSFDELNLDAWRQLLAAPPGTAAPAGAGLPDALHDYLPTSFMVQGNSLTVAGQKFSRLVAGGTRQGQVWRANLDARETGGYLEYGMPSEAGAGRVYARLARLVLAPEGARGVENLLEEQPVSIPALDVVIDHLELRGKNLGRAEIEAVNRGLARRDAGTREWRLNKLRLSMPEAEFNASGSWAVYQELSEAPERAAPARAAASGARGERRRTLMDFRLDMADAGGLLNRLGMPGLVRAGQGRMEGQAYWMGSPMALDYPTLGGKFNINVESGQFLKAEPGIAKLMGVLSLQALPRRLALDFRDVFTDGFSFDFVRGDVQVDQGIAMTNNLQMKGVNAAVLMEGHVDLARETQELRVVVVPEINAGTASLIATWINPAVGLGTFLAQMILRGPMIAATTQEFRISGSWTDPQMAKVEAAAPAEPAASSPQGNSP